MADFDDTDALDAAPPVARPDGPTSAAILMLLLEEQEAAEVLRNLGHDEVRTLAKSMFAAADANEAIVEAALDVFIERSRSIGSLSLRADRHIRTVMHEALGNVRADNILAALAPQSSAAALEILRWMDVDQIRAVVADEHPQVGALILSVLVPEVAAKVIEALDERQQTDLMLRAAYLSSVPSAAIEDLEAVLVTASQAKPSSPQQNVGGPGEVAKIIKQMPKPLSERAIRALKKQDRQLAQMIEEEMFVFENLRDLDKKTLGTVLRAVDAKQLGLALKGADEAMVTMCLGTMSKRAAETIRDEMADQTMVKRTDVEEAQRGIMQVVRQMTASGEIAVAGGGEDYV